MNRVMIEAEIKARVRDVTAVRSQLQERDLRQAISDLNQRLCYAAGEYDSPPPPVPLPP